MLSTSAQYRQMQQYHQRQCNHIDRFPSQQHSKPINSQRPNIGSELLAKLEQAGKVPSRDKFRRMCCQVIYFKSAEKFDNYLISIILSPKQTFLSTGGCPYNDRCVFLHDPRLQVESFRLRTVKNVRQAGTVKDTFYWPDMEVWNKFNSLSYYLITCKTNVSRLNFTSLHLRDVMWAL